MFEQDLPDSFVWQSNSPDSGDLITGFASFDYGLSLDTGPGVVIKGRMTCQTSSAVWSRTVL
jgi:hypothetical protein